MVFLVHPLSTSAEHSDRLAPTDNSLVMCREVVQQLLIIAPLKVYCLLCMQPFHSCSLESNTHNFYHILQTLSFVPV